MRPYRRVVTSAAGWAVAWMVGAVPAHSRAMVAPQSAGVAPILTITDQTRAGEGRDVFIVEREAAAQCGGQDVEPRYREALDPRVFGEYPRSQSATVPPPLSVEISPQTVAFAIDEKGEPHSIGAAVRSDDLVVIPSAAEEELQASLSAWRFPAEARNDCTLTVSSRRLALGDAGPALVVRALALSGGAGLGPDLRRALARPGDDCSTLPGMRMAVPPDRRLGATPAGGRSWSVVRFDLDEDGTPRQAEALASSGDAEWDAEVLRAVRATRLAAGPRRGCVAAFSRFGNEKPLPPLPDVAALNRCSADQRARLTPQRLVYPEAFLRRGIEGWAVVRFSMASWGSLNDVEILEAQPAQAFGDAAARLIRSGRVEPSREHAVGCVDRVIFRMPEAGEAADED